MLVEARAPNLKPHAPHRDSASAISHTAVAKSGSAIFAAWKGQLKARPQPLPSNQDCAPHRKADREMPVLPGGVPSVVENWCDALTVSRPLRR
jgi:hypothetical protein